jgi:hypothetical protein
LISKSSYILIFSGCAGNTLVIDTASVNSVTPVVTQAAAESGTVTITCGFAAAKVYSSDAGGFNAATATLIPNGIVTCKEGTFTIGAGGAVVTKVYCRGIDSILSKMCSTVRVICR